MTTLYLATEPAADKLLAENPFALLTGMLLDQQVTMESAFAGPAKLAERLGGYSPELVAERVQKFAATICADYDGKTEALWTAGDPDGAEVLKRLKKLPGFGDQKAKIFLSLLGKQFDLQAEGWREAAGEYGDEDALISAADIVDDETLQQVRENKKARKAQAKAAKQQK